MKNTFRKTEDRPLVRERVTYLKEHRPVEKDYVVETKFVGQHETGLETEHLGSLRTSSPRRPPGPFVNK